ncbi:hypothetical protein DRW41_17240 [Neobacillus piezotolerans]|uniref:Replication-relaxation n=1 Tax=Neobacillus piezotolerans TaxID=2259171 RepID=A0A3D8GLY6_9BACI|nr:replication-relaxation family protein [Neobacillus piezotolerans]RDU35485.1 hypothetical protein DRW41_17240 [Neobacillus piezotolerans]
MRKRDMAIVRDLERFRCLTRDDIIDLHFNGLKQPITSCNTVLKRLRRDGHIEVNKDRQPYIYFPSPPGVKKDSAKIPHFLKIVEVYKDLLKYEPPKAFLVEPKYGKGFMEPDVFMIWKRAPFFVEIQRSVYSERVMGDKVNRYEAYFQSGEWQKEPWQPTERKVFPPVILVTDSRYKIDSSVVKFIQIQNIGQLVSLYEPQTEIKSTGSLKLKSG